MFTFVGVYCHRLTTRSGSHVIDDVSVQQTTNNTSDQQQTATTTTSSLTDCLKSFTQQERVSYPSLVSIYT